MAFVNLICRSRFMTITIQANGYRGALKAALESLKRAETTGTRK